jgi:hypothetical protein
MERLAFPGVPALEDKIARLIQGYLVKLRE